MIDSLLAAKGQDRILFLSGGPKSHLARKSFFATGMKTRLVITQPNIVANSKHSPLNGETIICQNKPPMQASLQELTADGWRATRLLNSKSLSEMLRSLKPHTPKGAVWAGALAYDLVQWTQPIKLQYPPVEGEILAILWLVEEWSEQEVVIPELKSDPKPMVETSSHSDQEHANIVEKIKDSIEDGELYQLNFGRRWTGELSEDPAEIFHRLSVSNPAPFSGYIEAADLGLALASCSPEILLEVKGKNIMTAPIKGTRPRGSDIDQESLLRRDLVHDEKERAEHRMLVDLERNELGLVCKPGTVVQSRFDVEAYANVQHLVSQVSGELEESKDGLDALQALFPGGSITGCPKTVPCGAVDELEEKNRSFWCGSMGWVDVHNGQSTWNIMIRTLEARWGGKSWNGCVMAGGGITIGSQAEAEVAEAIWKAAALRRACGWLKADQKSLARGELGIYPLYVEFKPLENPSEFDLKIAFIDNLDSFSQNIVHALKSMGCEVELIDGRGPIIELNHDAILIGPGPGRPEVSQISMEYARRAIAGKTPTLGICLGAQALGLADGMEVVKSPLGPVHGVPVQIDSTGDGLLAKGEHLMTRYNSLVLSGQPNSLVISELDQSNTLVMGVSNRAKNIYGLQFHPESIGSKNGLDIIAEFLARVAHY